MGILHESRLRRLAVSIAALAAVTLGTRSSQAFEIGEHDLGVTLDFTYATKYMWHGYDVFDDHATLQPSITFDFWGGSAGVWGAWPASSGFEDLTELDYFASYACSFFSDERYAIDAATGFTYFSFPKIDSRSDSEEIWLGISFPNLISLGPSALVPSYEVYYDWDGVQSSDAVDNGWFHYLGLGYDVPIPTLLPDQEEQALSLSGQVVYNDGAYGSSSAWSHATAGVSTTFEWKQMYVTPAIHYQFSFEDSVNPDDEFCALISVGWSF